VEHRRQRDPHGGAGYTSTSGARSAHHFWRIAVGRSSAAVLFGASFWTANSVSVCSSRKMASSLMPEARMAWAGSGQRASWRFLFSEVMPGFSFSLLAAAVTFAAGAGFPVDDLALGSTAGSVGAAGVCYYNYGLLSPARLAWFRRANETI